MVSGKKFNGLSADAEIILPGESPEIPEPKIPGPKTPGPKTPEPKTPESKTPESKTPEKIENNPGELPKSPEKTENVPSELPKDPKITENDKLVGIEVSPQGKESYVLIPTFEVSSDSDQPRRKWPWSNSCVWYTTTNPATVEEYLLLQEIIKKSKSNNISSKALNMLKKFDPVKYSDSTRVDKKFLINELENLDVEVRAQNIPCAKVIRYDDKEHKTNLINKAKGIAVSTFKLNTKNTFRVQMNETLYVDLHFDGNGNYAGCAFLCGEDILSKNKFADNYLSENFNRGVLKGVLNYLSSFTVNGEDVRSKILESLQAAKTQTQTKKAENEKAKSTQDVKPNNVKDYDESLNKGAHTEKLLGRAIDFGSNILVK